MTFKCPACDMSLKAEPELAGRTVKCPGCGVKLQIPEQFPGEQEAVEGGAGGGYEERQRVVREGWPETDHANISLLSSLGIGAIIFAGLMGMIFALIDTYVGEVFFSWDKSVVVADDGESSIVRSISSGTIVNSVELMIFSWGLGMIWLKVGKNRHQRNAMLMQALPPEIGREINSANVGSFIDHLYSLPGRVRDSFMVNRLRKGLELFEARQNNAEVAGMLSSQSDIDANRVANSYSILKVFLWAIPILGFIGTVLGLSAAIGGLGSADFTDTEQISIIIGGVTSGLGTAFNTTLLGLVLSVILSFPVASMQKAEEDNLSTIDSYCNESLLGRLDDGAGMASGDMVGAADSIARAVTSSQKEFLKDLNELSKLLKANAELIESRAASHQQKVEEEFTGTMKKLREETGHSIGSAVEKSTQYLTALETGIRRLNEVLGELGSKQVVIQQVKKRGLFGK